METIDNKTYTLNEAYEVLKKNAEKFDWEIKGDLLETPTSFNSRNQEKRFLSAVRRACKKGTRRAFNDLFYKTPFATTKVELGQKEKTIQAKRKAWKELQAKADIALAEYKVEKGSFYKNISKKD